MTPRLTERDWQGQVIDLARLNGWRVAHFRAARTERGWRTPVEADGAGFPDLVLVRPPELMIAELKAERGRVSPDQEAWLDCLRSVAGAIQDELRILAQHCGDPDVRTLVSVHVWRPSDFDEVARRLAR